MKKIQVVLFALLVGSASQAFAQDEEPAEKPAEGGGEASGEGVNDVNEPVKEAADEVQKDIKMKDPDEGYGSAGCGLGTLLFEPSNGFTQVFVATTNGTSWSQTFGITSGTSNCDGAGYSPGSASAFIETNRSALAKDIARGKGATITGLTDLAGCTDSRAVGTTLKKNFGEIFPAASTSDREVSESVLRVLKSEASLSCTNLA